MEKLTDMLLDARKIKPENYRFDDATLHDIERFKQEFKGKQEEMVEALRQLEEKQPDINQCVLIPKHNQLTLT